MPTPLMIRMREAELVVGMWRVERPKEPSYDYE
jgi:hypothetical protein